MWKHWPYGAGAVGALAVVLALAWSPEALDWADDHEGAAAWVQGILTVATIGATAWISNSQWRRELRRRKLQHAQEINDLIDVVQYAQLSSGPLRSAIADRNAGHLWPAVHAWNESEAAAVLNRLLEMPVTDWPSPITMVRIRRYVSAVMALTKQAEDYASTINHSDGAKKFDRLQTRLGLVVETEHQAVDHLGRLTYQEG